MTSNKVNKPVVVESEYALPVELGGTGVININKAAANLGIVTNAMIGTANGPIPLDGTGKIPTSFLSVGFSNGAANLSGSFFVVVNDVVTFNLTDYDSFKTYTVTASAGTVSRNRDVITYTAPAAPATVVLTVNGRAYVFNVQASQPGLPTITSPVANSMISSKSLSVTSSAFVARGGVDTHLSTDWQIATDGQFAAIATQSLADAVNKTSWPAVLPNRGTVYYIRARYKGASGNYGPWSATVKITTAQAFTPINEVAKPQATDASTNSYFGCSLAVSSDGSRVAVGAYGKNSNAGAVYVFSRSGASWTQEAKILQNTPAASDSFGISLAMNDDGSRIVIGALYRTVTAVSQGVAYVFLRSGTAWSQESMLTHGDPSVSDFFGKSVAISSDGSRVAVGAYSKTGALGGGQGAVYVFLRTGVIWAQEAKLMASDTAVGDGFGGSISITTDASRLVIGAYAKSGTYTGQGAVYVFTRTGTVWSQEAKLLAADPAANDVMGWSVSVSSSGSRVAASAYYKTGTSANQGAVYVFLRSGVSWAQEAKLLHTDPAATDYLGWNICMNIDGSKVLAGCGTKEATYSFTRNGVTWTQERKYQASDKVVGDQFGRAVTMTPDGSWLVIGAPAKSTNTGATYIEN